MLEDSSNAEVSDLDLVGLSHEDVLRLQVTMQYLPIMDVLNRKAHLHEPVKNLILTVHYYNICYGPDPYLSRSSFGLQS
jgi:hypothetical protein